MKEQDYQKKIVKLLEDRGAYTAKVIVASKKGVPDIVACVPMSKEQVLKRFETTDTIGVFMGIEVKTPSTMNNVSKLQEYNLKKINDAGGIAIVAWSVNRIEEICNGLRDSL